MIGLVKKDVYLLVPLLKSYALIVFTFALMCIFGLFEQGMLLSVLFMVGMMASINVFALDEQSGWDRYAAALPTGRDGVVKARYLFTLLICLCFATVVLLLGVLHLLRLITQYWLYTGGMMLAVLMLAYAVLLPLLFRFGAQKGRLMLALVFGCMFGAVIGVLTLFKGRPQFVSLSPLLITLALIAAGLLALWCSYRISRGIYRRKDL